MELTAVLTPAEEGGFIALNPETGTTTQGDTVEEAVANLKEATSLYLSEFPLPSLGHPVVVKRESKCCVVPMHGEVKTGTLVGVLRQSEVPVEELMQALRK